MSDGYLLENGVDRLLLEDGSGIYLLEDTIVLALTSSSAIPIIWHYIVSQGHRYGRH